MKKNKHQVDKQKLPPDKPKLPPEGPLNGPPIAWKAYSREDIQKFRRLRYVGKEKSSPGKHKSSPEKHKSSPEKHKSSPEKHKLPSKEPVGG